MGKMGRMAAPMVRMAVVVGVMRGMVGAVAISRTGVCESALGFATHLQVKDCVGYGFERRYDSGDQKELKEYRQ